MRKMRDLHSERGLQEMRLDNDKPAPAALLTGGQVGRVEKEGEAEKAGRGRETAGIKTFK